MNKEWWKSRACWAGVLLLITALAKAIEEWLNTGSFDVASFITAASQGLGFIGVRLAMK